MTIESTTIDMFSAKVKHASKREDVPQQEDLPQGEDVQQGEDRPQEDDFQALLEILNGLGDSPQPTEAASTSSRPVEHTTPKAEEPASTPPKYEPLVEPITPVKKGFKTKNPGFKRHRSFPYPSLPPYKY
jgi:hypothetical protein